MSEKCAILVLPWLTRWTTDRDARFASSWSHHDKAFVLCPALTLNGGNLKVVRNWGTEFFSRAHSCEAVLETCTTAALKRRIGPSVRASRRVGSRLRRQWFIARVGPKTNKANWFLWMATAWLQFWVHLTQLLPSEQQHTCGLNTNADSVLQSFLKIRARRWWDWATFRPRASKTKTEKAINPLTKFASVSNRINSTLQLRCFPLQQGPHSEGISQLEAWPFFDRTEI